MNMLATGAFLFRFFLGVGVVWVIFYFRRLQFNLLDYEQKVYYVLHPYIDAGLLPAVNAIYLYRFCMSFKNKRKIYIKTMQRDDHNNSDDLSILEGKPIPSFESRNEDEYRNIIKEQMKNFKKQNPNYETEQVDFESGDIR